MDLDTVLIPLPHQLADLPGGRLLVRHGQGLSVLGGTPSGLAQRLRTAIGRTDTAAEVLAELADILPEDRARRLLADLEDEVWTRHHPAPHGQTKEEEGKEPVDRDLRGIRLSVVGDGDLAESLAHTFGAAPAVERLSEAEPTRLVLAAFQHASYRDLFALQAEAWKAGLAVLFLTSDSDALRVGPLVLPGITPCLGCAQAAAYGFLELPTSELLSALGEFRSMAEPPRIWVDRAGRSLAAELRRIGNQGEEPGLAGAIELLRSAAPPLNHSFDRASDCPICAETPGQAAPDRIAPGLSTRLQSRLERARSAPRGVRSTEPLEGRPASIAIVGGGTAGYLAALALCRATPEIAVTLIESPDLPVIGVGEATTPLMPQFLHADLGIDIDRLIAEVRPTLKLGIRFLWGAPESGDFPYPFGAVSPLEALRHDGGLHTCSATARLMAAGRAGVGGELGAAVAYHLENRRFVAFLTALAEERGISRLLGTVAEAETSADGDRLSGLVFDDGRRFEADLYLDCTGFRCLLMGQAMDSPWHSFAKSLPTDRAWVGSLPNAGSPAPYTLAETYRAGWCWSTPQSDEDHRGYVFASGWLDEERAAAEMREKNPGLEELRLLRFASGRRRHFQRGNVIALGNAYGFVEPLESTALHLLIHQIGALVRALLRGSGMRPALELANHRVGQYWDYLAWFLGLHYRFNRKVDSDFWRWCQNNVDLSTHHALLETYREQGPLSYRPEPPPELEFVDPLWGAEGIDLLLMGQGVPHAPCTPRMSAERWEAKSRELDHRLASIPRHPEALSKLESHPESRRAFVAPFLEAGPAFLPKS